MAKKARKKAKPARQEARKTKSGATPRRCTRKRPGRRTRERRRRRERKPQNRPPRSKSLRRFSTTSVSQLTAWRRRGSCSPTAPPIRSRKQRSSSAKHSAFIPTRSRMRPAGASPMPTGQGYARWSSSASRRASLRPICSTRSTCAGCRSMWTSGRSFRARSSANFSTIISATACSCAILPRCRACSTCAPARGVWRSSPRAHSPMQGSTPPICRPTRWRLRGATSPIMD